MQMRLFWHCIMRHTMCTRALLNSAQQEGWGFPWWRSKPKLYRVGDWRCVWSLAAFQWQPSHWGEHCPELCYYPGMCCCCRCPFWPFPRCFLSLLSFGGQPLQPCPTPNSLLSDDKTTIRPASCNSTWKVGCPRGWWLFMNRSNTVLPSVCSSCLLWAGRGGCRREHWLGQGSGERGAGLCWLDAACTCLCWLQASPFYLQHAQRPPSDLWTMNLRLFWVIGRCRALRESYFLNPWKNLTGFSTLLHVVRCPN